MQRVLQDENKKGFLGQFLMCSVLTIVGFSYDCSRSLPLISEPEMDRSSFSRQICFRTSRGVHGSVLGRMALLLAAVQTFHAQENVTIYASHAIRIFFVYSLSV